MNSKKGQELDFERQMPLKTNTRPIILVAFIGLIFAFGSFLLWVVSSPR